MGIRELALEVARAEAASPRLTWRGYDRFRPILGREQLALVEDPARLVSAHPGRRGGKTTAFIGKLLKVWQEREKGKVFYFAPTGEQGIDILWEHLRNYNATFDLGLKEHWSEKVWTLDARRLEVFSFHDRKDVDRARGRFADLVCVDEGGLAPDWFASQFEAAILPVTVDYKGQAWAIGTPAPVAEGFFFDACHDADKWSVGHHWTANENPFFVAQGRDVLAEVREEFKFTEDNVTYRREWKGEWVVDPDALVYYIPPEAIRTVTLPSWYGNIIGLDLGWKDHDAIAAVGIEPLRQWSHLRHMETKGQQTNHQLFDRLKVLCEHFPGPPKADGGHAPIVVYDPAGHATKKTIETFRSDAPQIMWVEAEKREKVQHIEWLNNDLRAGTTTVEAGNSMIREALRLRWKRAGKVAEDADHSDQGDAWLYPWRYARNLLRKLPVKRVKSEDPFDQRMERMREGGEGGTYFGNRIRSVG